MINADARGVHQDKSAIAALSGSVASAPLSAPTLCRANAEHAAKKSEIRRQFPLCVAWIEKFRREFDDGMPAFGVRVIYLSENGNEWRRK